MAGDAAAIVGAFPTGKGILGLCGLPAASAMVAMLIILAMLSISTSLRLGTVPIPIPVLSGGVVPAASSGAAAILARLAAICSALGRLELGAACAGEVLLVAPPQPNIPLNMASARCT